MTTTIALAPGAPVDLSTLIDTRLLVQANSGGGKSWCLRRLLKLGASAVLDIYELKAHERVRFVRGFLEALVDAPKTLWHPTLVVVDEAHVYCPQTGEAESAGAVIDLATRGRKRGFCAILATQRLSKLHKDAAAECNNKLIGRTGLDVDMKRAGDDLGFPRDRLHELRELPEGHFFAFGPAISRSVTRVHVGPVSTSHPKAGGRLAFTAPPPTEKVRALLPKLADLPAEAEARQKSIADLTRDLATARRELTLAKQTAPAPERIEVPVLLDDDRDRIDTLAHMLRDAATSAAHLVDEIRGCVARVVQALDTTARRHEAMRPVRDAKASCAPTTRPSGTANHGPHASRRSGPVAPAGTLTGPEQRIVDAIAWLASIGVDEPEQTAVAFLAGYTYGGGAFNNPRGALRTRGLVDYVAGDRIRLTEEGRAAAHQPDAPLTTAALHACVLARLPGPEQRLLGPLLAAFPQPLSNEDLARQAGYTPNAGAFNNPRGRLRSLGLVDYPQPGYVAAKALLFLE